MPLAQDKRNTYADILSWPETNERYELFFGESVLQAAPSPKHQTVLGQLFRALSDFLDGKPCRALLSPCDVRLFETAQDTPETVDTVVQPDLMVICDQDQIDEHGIHGAPTLVVEILSPTTLRTDRITKFSLYEQAGVPEYWIVDPEKQTVLVFSLDDGKYHAPIAYGHSGDLSSVVLEGFTVSLDSVFAG